MSFTEQARVALQAHYTRKGLKGDKLNETVERVLAVQFKPLHCREGGGFNHDKVVAALDKVRALHREVEALREQADALHAEADAKVQEAAKILGEFELREAA